MHPRICARGAAEPVLIAVVLFVVYTLGACPTIYVGDSGELVAAVATLGIPHPSGYPLYVLLGKLWTLVVPVGSVAYRMSLFSAAAGALACALVWTSARRLGLGRPAAYLAALLLAFSPSFWSQANVQRVYTLNALFVVLATLAAMRWRERDDLPSLCLAFFVCGLGATNHTFMVIYGACLAAFVVITRPSLLTMPAALATRAAASFAAFVVGLLPYSYLVIRSRMDPRLDWGNPETLGALSDVVFRRDFWERAWIESPLDLLPIAGDYLFGLGRELAWAGAALAVVGAVAGLRRRWPVVVLALLVMAANLGAMSLHGSRSDIFLWHRYYIPSYVMAALLAGIGWQAVVERLPRPAALAALVLPLALAVSGYGSFDRSRYRIAESFAYSVLESLPPGAHLIATDDNVLFVLIYLHLVEQQRPDIDLILQGVGKADLPPLHFDPDDDPVFFTHHPNWNIPQLAIVPVGVVYRAWRSDNPEAPAILVPLTELDGESDPRVPKDYLTQNLIGHFHFTLGTTFEGIDWLRARAEFDRAAEIASGNDVLFYNLGLIYARNGLFDDARTAFQRSHEINPRHLASHSKPRATDKIAELVVEADRVARIERSLRNAHPDLPASGTAAHHAAMAELLEAAGEPVAARGHRLQVLALEPPA